jgi:hypothetical protein
MESEVYVHLGVPYAWPKIIRNLHAEFVEQIKLQTSGILRGWSPDEFSFMDNAIRKAFGRLSKKITDSRTHYAHKDYDWRSYDWWLHRNHRGIEISVGAADNLKFSASITVKNCTQEESEWMDAELHDTTLDKIAEFCENWVANAIRHGI